MRVASIAASLLIAVPAAAQSIPDLNLAPGESVAVSFDDGGHRTVARGRAEWTPMTLYAARELAGQAAPSTPQTEAVDMQAPVAREVPAANQLRFRFLPIAGGQHTLLAIDNGLDIPLRHRARITYRGRTEPTDVCILTPHMTHFEHWSYPIERIELGSFQRANWHDGMPVTCE